MEKGLYSNNFPQAFSKVLEKCDVSRYKVAQYSNLDEGYLGHLKTGERNPGPETIVKISVALAHHSDKFDIHDAEALFKSVGRTLFTKR